MAVVPAGLPALLLMAVLLLVGLEFDRPAAAGAGDVLGLGLGLGLETRLWRNCSMRLRKEAAAGFAEGLGDMLTDGLDKVAAPGGAGAAVDAAVGDAAADAWAAVAVPAVTAAAVVRLYGNQAETKEVACTGGGRYPAMQLGKA